MKPQKVQKSQKGHVPLILYKKCTPVKNDNSIVQMIVYAMV